MHSNTVNLQQGPYRGKASPIVSSLSEMERFQSTVLQTLRQSLRTQHFTEMQVINYVIWTKQQVSMLRKLCTQEEEQDFKKEIENLILIQEVFLLPITQFWTPWVLLKGKLCSKYIVHCNINYFYWKEISDLKKHLFQIQTTLFLKYCNNTWPYSWQTPDIQPSVEVYIK